MTTTMKQLLADTVFFQKLREFDQENFKLAKSKGCPHCGGPLDTANYYRKTRGMEGGLEVRFCLCCCREGCRKRLRPPSLRFFGRRVYFSAVVILAADFCKQLGLAGLIARQTLARWKAFWRECLSAEHVFFRWAKGGLVTPEGPT
jgi:hypothetical protein